MKKILTIPIIAMAVAALSSAATIKLEPAKHKKLNVFFSNFSEATVGSFAQGELSDQAMLDFAFRHLYLNNFKALKSSEDGLAVIATTRQVDAATVKYFGQKVVKHKKSSYAIPCADGETLYFSQLDALEQLGNQKFVAAGTIYSTGSGGTPDVHGTPADWKKAGEEVSVEDKFSAVIKSEGERYILIEYTLAGDAKAQTVDHAESATANHGKTKVKVEDLKGGWAEALAAPEKVTKLNLACEEESAESPQGTEVTLTVDPAAKHLPSALGAFTQLQKLEISGLESLEDLPAEIGDLKKLESIVIDNGNGYRMNISLPETIGSLTRLKVLRLYGALDARAFEGENADLAKVKKLPQALAKLKNLEVLDLGRNGLTQFPPQIASLASLTSLCLDFNTISELPEFVGNLANLRTLEIHSNGGTKLPDSLKNLKGLNIGMGNASLTLKAQEALRKRFPDANFDFTNGFDDDIANQTTEDNR